MRKPCFSSPTPLISPSQDSRYCMCHLRGNSVRMGFIRLRGETEKRRSARRISCVANLTSIHIISICVMSPSHSWSSCYYPLGFNNACILFPGMHKRPHCIFWFKKNKKPIWCTLIKHKSNSNESDGLFTPLLSKLLTAVYIFIALLIGIRALSCSFIRYIELLNCFY